MGVNAVMFYMMEKGMSWQGSVKLRGNVPCVKCGKGDECGMSGIAMIFGPYAKVDTVGIDRFEDDEIVMQAARFLGSRIAAALAAR